MLHRALLGLVAAAIAATSRASRIGVDAKGSVAGCATDLDCELAGSCDAASGLCRCHPGWVGPTCGTLDLLPAKRRGAWPADRPVPPEYWGDGATPVSWGGTIGLAADRRWHMVVDTGCYNPGRTMHVDGFQLSHAVSETAEGPYAFVGPAVSAGPTHYNPHMAAMPGGRWLLFYAGEPTPHLDFGVSPCSGNETRKAPPPGDQTLGAGNCTVDDCWSAFCVGWGADDGELGAAAPNNATCLKAGCAWDPGFASCMPPAWASPRRSQIKVAIADSPAGPWESVTDLLLADGPGLPNPGFIDNPTALVAADSGSPSGYRVTLAFRFPGNDTVCGRPRCSPSVIGLATATDWRGPYHTVSDLQWPGRKAVLPYLGETGWCGVDKKSGCGCEDPTLFRGRNGSYHMLVHAYVTEPGRTDAHAPGWPGLHAFSPDGSPGSWQVSNSPDLRGAYSFNVSWQGGGHTLFRRRERPQLVTDPDTGDPMLLVTGLEYGGYAGAAGPGGQTEYSFTLVQKIRAAAAPSGRTNGER